MEVIYKLTDNDFKQIIEIENIIFNKNLENIYIANSSIKFICVKIDEKVIGYISYKEDIEYIEIYNLAVDENNRNSGVAKELINKLPKKNTYLEVRQDNDKAINLYKRSGFNLINTRKNYYNGVDALVYERLA